jgi:hypothetical protein
VWGKKPEMSRLLSDLFQASATLIPTILVVVGIVFLLLSIAGHLAGRIAVPPERQRQAAIMGGLLVVVGLTLHVAPLLRSPSTSPEVPPVPRSEPPAGKTPSSPTPETLPSSPSSPPASDPTTQLYKVESLRSLDARVTALRFFAGDCYMVPRAPQRKYTRRFSTGRRGVRVSYAIYTEITLEHPPPERRIYFTLKAIYQSEDTGVIDTLKGRTYIPLDQQSSVHWIRLCGFYDRVGVYPVDVYINEQKVASGSFEIYSRE